MKRIRIMIVDDQDVVRRGLNLFFASIEELEVVAEAANGDEAIQLCDEILPDVILMDLMMPKMDGVTATKIIHEKHPDIQVIALSSVYDSNAIKQMQEAGAHGYLLKNSPVDDLKKTILAAGKVSQVEH